MNTLKAERRSMDIKAKRLRREGYVTGNLFGKEIEGSIPLKFPKAAIAKLLQTENKGGQVMLEVDGKTYDALIKDIAYNSMAGRVDEIDFQALVSNEKVHSVAEIIVKNTVAAGILEKHLTEVSYKALPADLVEKIELDVSNLKVGESIKAKDLDIAKNEKISLITDPEAIIVTVSTAHNAAIPETETTEETAE